MTGGCKRETECSHLAAEPAVGSERHTPLQAYRLSLLQIANQQESQHEPGVSSVSLSNGAGDVSLFIQRVGSWSQLTRVRHLSILMSQSLSLMKQEVLLLAVSEAAGVGSVIVQQVALLAHVSERMI